MNHLDALRAEIEKSLHHTGHRKRRAALIWVLRDIGFKRTVNLIMPMAEVYIENLIAKYPEETALRMQFQKLKSVFETGIFDQTWQSVYYYKKHYYNPGIRLILGVHNSLGKLLRLKRSTGYFATVGSDIIQGILQHSIFDKMCEISPEYANNTHHPPDRTWNEEIEDWEYHYDRYQWDWHYKYKKLRQSTELHPEVVTLKRALWFDLLNTLEQLMSASESPSKE